MHKSSLHTGSSLCVINQHSPQDPSHTQQARPVLLSAEHAHVFAHCPTVTDDLVQCVPMAGDRGEAHAVCISSDICPDSNYFILAAGRGIMSPLKSVIRPTHTKTHAHSCKHIVLIQCQWVIHKSISLL